MLDTLLPTPMFDTDLPPPLRPPRIIPRVVVTPLVPRPETLPPAMTPPNALVKARLLRSLPNPTADLLQVLRLVLSIGAPNPAPTV